MRSLWIPLLLAAAIGVAAFADEEGERDLAPGDEAPAFRLNDHEGRAVMLAGVRKEKWAVLAFFPKAATPG